MERTCYFSGHNVSLLMSLCCIILVASHIPVMKVCNEVFFLFVIKNFLGVLLFVMKCTCVYCCVCNEVYFLNVKRFIFGVM